MDEAELARTVERWRRATAGEARSAAKALETQLRRYPGPEAAFAAALRAVSGGAGPRTVERLAFLSGMGLGDPRLEAGRPLVPATPIEEACAHELSEPSGSGGSSRLSWARLMKRVFALDVQECPRCGSRMQTIAFVMGAEPIPKILTSMGYPADSPWVFPARSHEELYELDPAA